MLYWRRVKAETTAPVGRHQRFKTSPRASAFRDRFFPDATAADWNDWRWQLRNRIRDLDGLVRVLRVSDDERAAIMADLPGRRSRIRPEKLAIFG